MRSESTSAFGQPSETKPTLGDCLLTTGSENQERRSRRETGKVSLGGVTVRLRRWCGSAFLIPAAALVRLFTWRRGEVGKGKAAKEIARLRLKLVLHVHECARAL